MLRFKEYINEASIYDSKYPRSSEFTLNARTPQNAVHKAIINGLGYPSGTTFKKSDDLASTFKDIPNNKILVETDAPYLAPVPQRGKSNEPSYIVHTVKFLSVLKKISFKDFSAITTNNFYNLFGKLS